MSLINIDNAPSCEPTWRGRLSTTRDALLIFEACFNGVLTQCRRRPRDHDRSQLIVSGNVFVYNNVTSDITRWTDGIPWSPSRMLGDFFIYRQLDQAFPPGKRQAIKRGQKPPRPGIPYSTNTLGVAYDNSHWFAHFVGDDFNSRDINQDLLGSLIDSYPFKEGGFIKKTLSIVIDNVHHHLVSYYSLEDARHNLKTPRDDPRLESIIPRDGLLYHPKFKGKNGDNGSPHPYLDNGYSYLDHGSLHSYLDNGYSYLDHGSPHSTCKRLTQRTTSATSQAIRPRAALRETA